jgi:putative hemolysin
LIYSNSYFAAIQPLLKDNGLFTQVEVLQLIAMMLAMLVLLIMSAFISASEVAFFSLKKAEIQDLVINKNKSGKIAADLVKNPKKLLTTILIFNNSINIGLVLLSTIFVSRIAIFGGPSFVYIVIQVVVVTSFLLLFGEILPKIYATKKGLKTILFMARPILFLSIVFHFFSKGLIAISSLFDKVFKEEKRNISIDELSKVHDIVENHQGNEQEQKMLDGILEFGNTDVKMVMKPRVDVTAIDIAQNFAEVKELILASGFSRIPVYESSFDEIKGLLYVKDLLPHLSKGKDFSWQLMVRKPFFVPENKKLDDLLIAFQEKKIHLAIVIDEYGGTSGIITMEDVLEEIIGDIKNEFDDAKLAYSKLDEQTFVLDGKIQLKDLYRILNIEGEDFDKVKGDSDTVAGFVLEQKGDFPFKGEKIIFDDYVFEVEAMDKKRIKRVKLEIK